MSTPALPPRVAELVKPFNRAERLAVSGCVVVLVASVFTWKGVSLPSGVSVPGANVNGFHGWGFLTLLIAAGTLAFLVARSPFFRETVALPRLPLADGPLLMAAAAGEVVTLLLFSGEYGTGRSAKLGFYLVLIGAALTAAGGYLTFRAAQDLRSAPAPDPEAEQRAPRGGGPPVS